MKYQLLNPAPHFLEVVENARAVIMAGGTMSPVNLTHQAYPSQATFIDFLRGSQISDVVNQLLSQVPKERVTSFSCGHIIPSANLLTLALAKGPRGGDLEYKAGKQSDPVVVSCSLCLPTLRLKCRRSDRRTRADHIELHERSSWRDDRILPIVQFLV